MRDSNELTRKKSLLWQVHMHTLQNNLDITAKAIVSTGPSKVIQIHQPTS